MGNRHCFNLISSMAVIKFKFGQANKTKNRLTICQPVFRYEHLRVTRSGTSVHNDKLGNPHKIKAFGCRQTDITPLYSQNKPAKWLSGSNERYLHFRLVFDRISRNVHAIIIIRCHMVSNTYR